MKMQGIFKVFASRRSQVVELMTINEMERFKYIGGLV